MPLIQPRSLWSAVDQENGRVLLSRLPHWRFQDEALHAVATRALEPEVFHGIHGEPSGERVVLVCELPRVERSARLKRCDVHFCRTLGRVTHPCERASVG